MNLLYIKGPIRKKKQRELDDNEDYNEDDKYHDPDEYDDWDGYDDEKDYMYIDDPYCL